MPDQVHLPVGHDPTSGIHRLVELLNSHSSHALREVPYVKVVPAVTVDGSYFVGTMGGATWKPCSATWKAKEDADSW